MSSAPYTLAKVVMTDSSPMITYTGDWSYCWAQSGCTLNATGELGLGQSYHNASANNPGVKGMQLTFTGDQLHIFGNYSGTDSGTNVTVDNISYHTTNATSAELNHIVSYANGLSDSTNHNMVVQTNGPFNFLHFEIFVQSTQLLSNYTIQYNDPSIQYSGTWSTPTLNGLTSPTAQSSDPAAMMALNFTGVGVVMQASMDNNNGPYNIVFDGQTSSYTPNVQGWTLPPAILYYALDLQAGQHTLTMSNTGAGGSTLTLSSITIVQLASEVQTTTAPTGASISPTASANGSTADSGRTTNVGAIAGGVIGGIALLALLALVALLLLRRRRRVDPLSPTPFIPTMHTPLPPPSVLEKTTEASVITNTVTGASVRNPPASLVNDPDAQNEVVDRVLEILASRIDAHPLATTSGSSASEPPEYRDTRTASQRL